MPRMCLMRVVLPAPLPPMRPKTPPRWMVSETSSRAVLSPKRRVTRWSSMTGGEAENGVDESGACIGLGLRGGGLHGGVTPLDKFENVFKGDVHLAGFGQERVDALVQDFDALAARERRAL